MRYVVVGDAPENFDGLFEDDDRSCPIYVVVAIDQDPLAIPHGFAQALHGWFHVAEQGGVVQGRSVRAKKLTGGMKIGVAAVSQDFSRQACDTQACLQLRNDRLRGRRE